MDVPNPLIPENPDWTGFFDFGAPWFPGFENPWGENGDVPLMAPFDKRVSNAHKTCKALDDYNSNGNIH